MAARAVRRARARSQARPPGIGDRAEPRRYLRARLVPEQIFEQSATTTADDSDATLAVAVISRDIVVSFGPAFRDLATIDAPFAAVPSVPSVIGSAIVGIIRSGGPHLVVIGVLFRKSLGLSPGLPLGLRRNALFLFAFNIGGRLRRRRRGTGNGGGRYHRRR